MVSRDESIPSLVPLKELMPLYPWRTPTPSFPNNLNKSQYMKLKEPFAEAVGPPRVFWQPKALHDGDKSDLEIMKIPYQGLFEFIDRCVIKYLKRLIDRLLGQVFGLPKYDHYNSRFRR